MEIKRITLRMPDDIYDWVSERADKNTTTITAEIIAILRLEMDGGYIKESDVRKIIQQELAKQSKK